MVRPTSLWTGGVFRGVVCHGKGKPIPPCRIEIEYYNKDGAVAAPDPSCWTEILKTDAQGTFSFTPVHAGWWALTALPDTGKEVKGPDGKMAEAETGGVLWIQATDMK